MSPAEGAVNLQLSVDFAALELLEMLFDVVLDVTQLGAGRGMQQVRETKWS